MFAAFRADNKESISSVDFKDSTSKTAVALRGVGGSVAFISLLLSIQKIMSASSLLMVSALMNKGLEHLTFEGKLTYEERAGIV